MSIPIPVRSAAKAMLMGVVACSHPTIPDFVDCSVFPDPVTSPYVLPYAVGERFEVGNTFGHYTELNGGVGLYAVDFRMPMGTSVRAARHGVVVAVEDRFSDDDHADYHENWVMIRHADESVGRYIHIMQGGALVQVGDTVAQGQEIARSGNSGASSRPHTHFDVQTCGPNLPPGYNDLPCGMTLPLSFRNTAREACGLREDHWYTAEPFEPDDR